MQELLAKHVLTTGEAARLCSVAPRTVSKWFDGGRLAGYRIPGSKDRRIPRDTLVRFMRQHGIPIPGEPPATESDMTFRGTVTSVERLPTPPDDRRPIEVQVRAFHEDSLGDKTPKAFVTFSVTEHEAKSYVVGREVAVAVTPR